MVVPSRNLQELFDTVIDLPPDEQRAYLDSHCSDPDTRTRLERLIRRDKERSGRFGTSPVSALLSHDDGPGAGASSTGQLDLTGETLGGRYHVLEAIGEGGMGVVYRAEQRAPVTREVAIKALKPGMDTKRVIARFEAERQALARMSHPGIAQVFDAGATEQGTPYFVMELVRGVPITRHCDAHGLDTDERIGLMLRVCDAVQHAHTRGVIHRDLKPANVLIDQASSRPVIIDFGVAKAIDEALTAHTIHTEHGQLIGTPGSMSPEQADLLGSDADTRTDVYTLGVILYELLSGHPPFDHESLRLLGFAEMQRVIREVDPPRVSKRAEDRPAHATSLRGDLDWIVATAMAKDRDDRYQSAAELAEDLRRRRRGEPVLARPPTLRYLAARFVRRNRAPVYAGAALALTILAATAATGLLAVSQSRHAADAERAAARSDSVNIFLNSMLQQARELGGNGLNVTMGQVLAATAERLEGGELAGQPGVEIEVREIIARTYHDLGWPGLSVPHAQWVVDHADAHYGPDDERTIEALWLCGEVLKESGKRENALAIFRRFFGAASRVLGPDDARTWHALDEIGNTLFRMGRPQEALPAHERALREMRRLEGDDSWRTALCMFNLGGAHRALGNWEQAHDLYTRALPVFDRAGGLAVTSAGRIRVELAIHILPALGRTDEGAQYMREALENARRELGEDHGETRGIRQWMAFFDLNRGDREAAYESMRWVVDHRRRIFGVDSHEHASTRYHAAHFYLLAGDDNAAIREAHAGLVALDTPAVLASSASSMETARLNNRVRAMTERMLAQGLLNTGDPVGAHAAARRAVALAVEQPEVMVGWELEAGRQTLAAELAMGLVDGLEPRLLALLDRAERLRGPDSDAAARARHTLARCLVRLGREGEAAVHFALAAPVLEEQAKRFRPLPPLAARTGRAGGQQERPRE